MLFKRIWAKLTFGRLVCLYDFDDQVTITIARCVGNKIFAERWWPFSIRTVELRPDGKCGNGGSYVTRWEWVD